MALQFYKSVAKGLKLKVNKFWGITPTSIEVKGEKLAGGLFTLPFLKRVNTIAF